MSLAQLVVTAVRIEGRTKAEVSRDYGVSPRWVYELCRRFDTERQAGLEPRSRRPHRSPQRTPEALEDEIVELRKELLDHGLDAGAHTIITHWKLASGTEVEILHVIDDHSRLVLASRALGVFKAADVVATFHEAAATWGFPAQMLTDNGAVFTAAPRGGRCAMELELASLGIGYVHSSPYHPQTCGKVERFHQTAKRFLAKQPKARSIEQLQSQLDLFVDYYNEVRPHRAIGRRTPAAAFAARPKATPAGPRLEIPPHYRVRRDKIDITGVITLRHNSRLHHIGLGRRLVGTRVLVLIDGLRVRVLTEDGELIRELTLDPTRDYQPHGRA